MTAPPPETTFQELKRYVRFGDDDARRLAAFGTLAAPQFPRIAAEFYERIREHDEAHAVFTGEEQIARLQRTLVTWMASLCAGPHDEAYFEQRARIGAMHVRIGLPQRYMFTAMALIRVELERISDALPAAEGAALRSSLARILELDLAIILESYREHHLDRIQRMERVDRELLERALARSEHRYASAVELARLLVVGLDAAGSIVLFNREAERVSGYARDEARGQGFVDLLLPEPQRNKYGVLLARALTGATPEAPWEIPLCPRAGRERTVRWQLAATAAGPDDEVVLYALGTDVTDERALRERTLQSEKLAAIGTLAAGLAHEIRNPLNGALLHVTFLERALKRSGGDAEALETARFIGAEIQRLSALVRDFLVFARPAPPELRETSLRAVCAHTFEVAQADAARAKATLVADYGPHDVLLPLDPGKIEQALLNLVRNAIDAVGATGGGRVTLRWRRQPRDVVVEVEDEGPGLPSPEAPIFDAFYTTKPNGTGLGLAIVHRIVTDHGGTIGSDSRPGRTVFRVVLPLSGGSQARAT